MAITVLGTAPKGVFGGGALRVTRPGAAYLPALPKRDKGRSTQRTNRLASAMLISQQVSNTNPAQAAEAEFSRENQALPSIKTEKCTKNKA